MTQIAGPIQLKGANIASRPATGVDRQPFFSRDEAKLYIWDATIHPSGAWVGITSDAVSVDFELNGNPLGVQNKVNFTDDGIFQITELADGELHFDSAGVIGSANTYTDDAVAVEAVARANAVSAEASARATAVSNEATSRSSADTTLNGLISAEVSARISAVGSEASTRSGADTTLQSNITAEAAARAAAISALVFPATKTAVSHQWLKSYDASTGLWTQTQPDYSDLSGTPTLPVTKTNAAHKWLNSYDSATGAFTQTTPDYSDLTGTPSLAAVATSGAYSDLTGKPQLAQTEAGASNNFLTAYSAATGLFSKAQPSFANISGTVAASQLPTPTTSTFGGVKDLAAVSNSFLTSVVNGVPITAQPSFSNISGSVAAAQLPNPGASALGGVKSLAAASTKFLTSIGTDGLPVATQPAFSDLSGSIAAGQIASGTVLWNTLGNAGGALTLANGTNNSTFNHTSAVTWLLANTTAATSSANNSSPIFKLASDMWSNGADTASGFALQSIISAAPNSKSITNSVENSSNISTLTVGSSHGFVVGNRVTFTGLTTMTWLNGTTCAIVSIAATTISVTDPTSHSTSASHADTGTCTLVPPMEFTFTPSGTAGDSRVMFPVSGVANANAGLGGFAFAGQSAFCGYGPLSLSLGGLAIYGPGGSSSIPCINLYRTSPAAASNSLTQAVATWEYGDNSGGNSTSSIATQVVNMAMGILGSTTTGTSNPCVFVGGGGGGNNNFTGTSGAQIGFGIGYGKAVTNTFNFAPASGTATFLATDVKYTINQTGGANGNVVGLQITATETAVGGTHKPLRIMAGSSAATEIFYIDNTGNEVSTTANGAQWIFGSASELLTLSTAGLTTDTAGNLLPAGAIIDSVVCRVTTAITTTTDWAVGDGTTSARFSSANSTKTLGTTSVGLNHMSGAVTTLAAGPSQAAAAKVRITCTGSNPGAGAIRITVFYRQFVAPTS